jgi:hypothetical protein
LDTDNDDRGPGCPAGPDCSPGDSDTWQLDELWRDADGDGESPVPSELVCTDATVPTGWLAAANGDDCDDDNNSVTSGCACEVRVRQDGDRYRFCRNNLNWTDAWNTCLGQSGTLLEPRAPGEAAWVHRHARQLGTANYWLALRDNDMEGTWRWESDDAVVALPTWAVGQPDDFQGEDCSQVWGDGDWNDQDCGSGEDYVCELGP